MTSSYRAQIQLGVTGLEQLNKAQASVSRLRGALDKRFDAAFETGNLDKLGVTLSRVSRLATRARGNLNAVDVNKWIELRGAVKRTVDTLELEASVRQKINRELDNEIRKRAGLVSVEESQAAARSLLAQKTDALAAKEERLARIQPNLAASRAGRTSGNLNFSDPVAGSIRRNQANQERIFGAANARGAAVDAANAQNEIIRLERSYFLEVQKANEALFLRTAILRAQARESYARSNALSQDFGVNPVNTLRPAGVSDELVAYKNTATEAGKLQNIEAERLSGIERRRAALNAETDILNQQVQLQRQLAQDIYARSNALSRDFGVNPVNTLRPAGVSDEQVVRANANDFYGEFQTKRRKEALELATRQELTERKIQAALDRQAATLERSSKLRNTAFGASSGLLSRVGQGVQGGLIGGAFPALFGQGPNASLGGGVGGVLGGLIGGGGGSFAGGIVGSAVGKQLDDLATALKSPTQALDLLKTAGIELDDSTTSLVGELIDNNKLIEAQRVVYEGLNKTIGGDTVDEIIKADEAAQKLGKATAELNRELITGLAPIMTKLIEYATGAAKGLGPVIERLRSIMEFGGAENAAAEMRAGRIAGQRTQAKFGKMSTTIFGSAEAKAFFDNAFAEGLKNEKFNLRAAQGNGGPGPGLPNLDQSDRLKQEKAARDEAARESKRAADEAAQRAKQLAEQQLKLDKQLFDNRLALAKAVYDKEIALVNFKFDLARKQQQQEERIAAMQAPSSEARDVINAINDLRGAGREITDTLRGLRQEQQGLQRDLGAARSQVGMAGSMATREAAIQNNFQTAQGASAGIPNTLMGLPGIKEYLTGDKSSPGYRADHGGGNYHEHIAFATKALRDTAMAALKAQGVRIGSVNDGRHAKNSYHYSDQAFDVPAAQVPVGREQALSARVRAIVAAAMGGPAGVVAGGGAAPGASPDQAGVASAQGSAEQISAKLQGVTAQIQAYEAAANRIGQLNIEEFVLKLTQGFRDQTETLQNNTKELDRRSAALDNGVPMAAIDAEIKLTAINDALIKKEEALDDQLKKGEISTKAYTEAKTGLAAASRAAALASQEESAAISRNTGAQEARGLSNTGLDYDARLQALRDGRTELTEVEQLNLRILKGELTLAQAEAARLPILAAINDQKKRQLTEAEKALELYKSMDAVLVQGVGAAITGLIDKSRTLNDVLGDTLRSIGQLLINSALDTAIGSTFQDIFKKKANGGPVSAGEPIFVGDNKDGSLNSTSELFIPGISGYVASSTDVQAAVRGAVSTPMDPEASGGMTVARAAMERSMMASEQNYQAAVLGEMANSPIKIESRGMRADELPFITMEESDRRTAEAVKQAVKISDAKWRQATKNEVR